MKILINSIKKISFLQIVAFVFFGIAISSCNNDKKASNAKKDSIESANTARPSSNGNKYSIKSGKVTSVSEVMGMEQSIITYFDEFGAKECLEASAEMMGQKIHSRTIVLGDYIYQLDMLKKIGMKTKKSSTLPNLSIDFNKLSEDQLAKMKMKKVGTETFMDKTCDKYTIDSDMMKGYFLVWNNLALKTEGEAMKVKMKIEAKKIEENITIPAEIFTIPSDFVINEK